MNHKTIFMKEDFFHKNIKFSPVHAANLMATHYNGVAMTLWCLKSQAIQLFVQQFV